MSKEIATIYNEVPVEYSLEELKYNGPDKEKLKNMYTELEFYSFLKDDDYTNVDKKQLQYKEVTDINDLILKDKISIYVETNNSNYHDADIIGISIYDGDNLYYLDKEIIINNKNILDKYEKYTYDLKKTIVTLNKFNNNFDNCTFDAMISGYILNYNVKDDIGYLANDFGYEMPLYETFYKNDYTLENKK